MPCLIWRALLECRQGENHMAREPFTDHVAILRFLATSRWYLLVARVTTDDAGRVSIDPPVPLGWADEVALRMPYTEH